MSEEPKIIRPTADQIEEAGRIAETLGDIATGAQVIRWTSSGCEKTGELLSASDRLTMVAARLHEIKALLRTRSVYPSMEAK